MTQQERIDFLSSLIGLYEEEATILCNDNNFTTRVTKRDGTLSIVTRDFHRDRVNFNIRQSKICDATFG
jgi:hypothetical protein